MIADGAWWWYGFEELGALFSPMKTVKHKKHCCTSKLAKPVSLLSICGICLLSLNPSGLAFPSCFDCCLFSGTLYLAAYPLDPFIGPPTAVRDLHRPRVANHNWSRPQVFWGKKTIKQGWKSLTTTIQVAHGNTINKRLYIQYVYSSGFFWSWIRNMSLITSPHEATDLASSFGFFKTPSKQW